MCYLDILKLKYKLLFHSWRKHRLLKLDILLNIFLDIHKFHYSKYQHIFCTTDLRIDVMGIQLAQHRFEWNYQNIDLLYMLLSIFLWENQQK